ncbi:DUF4157 domain-containing protein [Streptomyces sp. A2-16]|nr:DUF4157 domain-containing protein [Streptomyces sp. A2-16]
MTTHSKTLCARAAGQSSLPPIVGEILGRRGQQLDAATTAAMSQRLGHDFSHVRVHTDGEAADAARALSARAFTYGRHVVMGEGEYRPHTPAGEQLLAHELVHTLQQTAEPAQEPRSVSSTHDSAELAAESSTGFGWNASPQHSTPVLVGRNEGQGEVRRASFSERWDAVTGIGPIDAWRAGTLAQEALTKAASTGLPGLHNGPADAWRHSYWNCRMASALGAGQAKIIADNHERHGAGPANETEMDLHNNAVGRACSGDCDVCVQNALDTGALRVIDSKGAVVPSGPSGRAPGIGESSGGYY